MSFIHQTLNLVSGLDWIDIFFLCYSFVLYFLAILKIPSRKIDDFGALIKELMQKTEDCLTVAKGFSTCILYSHTHTKQIHKKRFKELTSLDIYNCST